MGNAAAARSQIYDVTDQAGNDVNTAAAAAQKAANDVADTQAALDKAQDGFRRATPAAKCSSIKDAAKFCGDDMALIDDADSTSCDGSVCQPGLGGDRDTCCVTVVKEEKKSGKTEGLAKTKPSDVKPDQGGDSMMLPIAIGGGAVALLIVVGLAAFCMRKSNKEAGADNVQPVELGSQSHDRQVDVSLGVEPKPGMDDNTRMPAPSSPKKGAGYGNLDDEATTDAVANQDHVDISIGDGDADKLAI